MVSTRKAQISNCNIKWLWGALFMLALSIFFARRLSSSSLSFSSRPLCLVHRLISRRLYSSSPGHLSLTSPLNQMVTKQHATDVEDRVVLPKHAKPLHYELFLKPDLTSFVFEGRVNILYVRAFILMATW
jgi:hypothetical protein